MTQELKIIDTSRIVYSLNVKNLQHVANEELKRDLTEEEIKRVEDKLGDYISWYEAISLAIEDMVYDTEKEN